MPESDDDVMQEGGAAEEEQPVPDEEYVFPASAAQSAFWFLEQLSSGNTALGIPVRFRILGRLDCERAREAMQRVMDRHEALRTTFAMGDGGALEQIVHARMRVAWREVGIFDVVEGERAGEADRLGSEEAHTPFDLVRGPLFRVLLVRLSEGEAILHVTIHHAVSDGWSVGVIMDDFAEYYSALSEGREPALPELEIQFPDFAEWQAGRIAAGGLDAQTDYWRGRLAGVGELDIPTDFRRPLRKSWQGEILSRVLPGETVERIKALADSEGASLFMAYLAVFMTMLHRVTGQRDICVGSPVAGRALPEVQRVVGVFINTLLHRVDFSGNPSFREVLRRVGAVVADAMANQEIPYDHVVKAVSPERDLGRNPLTQANFTHQRSFIPGREFAGLRLLDMPSRSYGTLFDLHMFTVEREGEWRVSCEFSTDLFRAETAGRMLDWYLAVLEASLEAPDKPVAEQDLVAGAELARLLAWAGGQRPLPHETLADNFAAVAARFPDKPALVADGFAMTYAELDAASSAAASGLAALGLGAEEPVGISLPRSPGWVVAALAIQKAGGCHVPLDPSFPADRRGFLVRDTGLRIATDEVAERGVPIFRRIMEAGGRRPAASAEGRDRLACILHTSGSTGEPKGVEVTQAGVLRLVHGQDYIDFSEREVFAHVSTPTFDASTLEIWGALLHGGTVVVAPPDIESLEALGRLLECHGVTTLWLTASLFNQIIDDAPDILRGVHQLLAGGEALSLRHVRRAFDVLPPGIRLVNGYGPTENTTFTCCFPIPREFDFEHAASVPVGRPISGTTVHVLDEAMRPVPVGVPGELCAGGLGLARGYLNQPELTAKKFPANPFGPGRLYRTGDRVRWLPDGTIEFLGRFDSQLKIRGFRIEPGEIEHVLHSHPDVASAAVVSRETARGDRQLCAYIVPASDHETDPAALPESVRRLLASSLPAFMVPAAVTVLDALPLTPNGKLDARALPEPNSGRNDGGDAEPPGTDTEQTLAGLWERLLEKPAVQRSDNFFALGGHSILALKLFVDIEKGFGVRLPVATLFTCPTLRLLAAEIDSARTGSGRAGGILVPIRQGGGRPPLFCIHAGDGGIVFYRDFADAMDEGRPVYGVEAPWLVGGDMPLADIPSVATRYLGEIRRVQPDGPLRLAGFSFGGIVAFEAACQESAAGCDVAALVLFDTANPADPPRRMTFSERMARNLVDSSGSGALGRLKYLAGRAIGKVGAQMLKHREDEKADEARRLKREGEVLPADLRVLDSRRRSLEAMRAYKPGRFAGGMLLVTATELEPGWVFASDLGWSGVVPADRLTVVPMPGKHHTILRQPLAAHAAGIVSGWLETIEHRHEP